MPEFDPTELEGRFRTAYDRIDQPSRAPFDRAVTEPCDAERTVALIGLRRMSDIVRYAADGAPEAEIALMFLSATLGLAAIGADGRRYRITDEDFVLVVAAAAAPAMLDELASQLHGFKFNAGAVAFTGAGDPDALLERATEALRTARRRGRGAIEFVA